MDAEPQPVLLLCRPDKAAEFQATIKAIESTFNNRIRAAMAAALRDLLAEPVRLQEMGSRGRDLVSRYDWNRITEETEDAYREGIARLWRDTTLDDAADYLGAVQAVNEGDALRYYPGSARIARFFLRAQDSARLAELAADECALLRAEFAHDPQVHVHCGDGTLGMPDLAPFDAILVAAAAPAIPQPLLAQLLVHVRFHLGQQARVVDAAIRLILFA